MGGLEKSLKGNDRVNGQQPSVGRIVFWQQPWSEGAVNGTRVHPALITRVFSDMCVNLTVFLDGVAVPRLVSSAMVLAPEGDANREFGGWYWPPRV